MLAGQGSRLAQPDLREDLAARRVRPGVEVANQHDGVATVARLDVVEDDARRRQSRLASNSGGGPPGQVCIVDTQGPAAAALAQAHPSAGALDPLPGAGWLVGRHFQPEGAVGDEIKAIEAKENGAVFPFVPAVVAADADAPVPGQRLLQEGDLLRPCFLDAEDVRLDLAKDGGEGLLARWPVLLL